MSAETITMDRPHEDPDPDPDTPIPTKEEPAEPEQSIYAIDWPGMAAEHAGLTAVEREIQVETISGGGIN